MHPLIKAELENLQIKYGNKTMLTLDDYSELYNINRRNASQHLPCGAEKFLTARKARTCTFH